MVMSVVATSFVSAADYSVEPTVDGTRRRTGFPFPVFQLDTSSSILSSSFTQSASSGLQVFITENTPSMEFALPVLPAGFTLKQATLSWVETSDFLRPGNVHPLYGYAGNGVTEVADSFGGSLLVASVSNGVVDGRVRFDVTPFVADRYLAADGFVGFSVQNGGFYQTQSGSFPFISTFTEVGTYQIWGRLAADRSTRPILELSAIPEGSVGTLIGVGLLVLGLIRGAGRWATG
jgi:hypothetical protein